MQASRSHRNFANEPVSADVFAARETGGDPGHRRRSRLYLAAQWRRLVRRQRIWRTLRYLLFILALLTIFSATS